MSTKSTIEDARKAIQQYYANAVEIDWAARSTDENTARAAANALEVLGKKSPLAVLVVDHTLSLIRHSYQKLGIGRPSEFYKAHREEISSAILGALEKAALE